jgi:hypothetical protein
MHARILRSSGGGATWTTQRSGTTNALYDAAAASRYLVWAVGANGTILKATPD